MLERADPHMITPTADGATTDDRPWHESSKARLDKCSAVLYGAPLSAIADTQVGSGPAHSKVMRGARAKVLTAAPMPTARRERHQRATHLQRARRSAEPAQLMLCGTMPTATVMVRARAFGGALRWTTRTRIERGKTKKERCLLHESV